ncbi:GNAT family N-acetyltransferase [Gandjariella thermophila]|uniref:N-acetyltransferase domain-containing protein n=1 Tax=Gandjariella thermophila TaxID=1931992 RepID=A0A4D4JFC1_9PSEU|nr:GNAT family N-acetyltransferase [Gandjariella thermophila]GDY33710.1 hypothetical protein GTS_53430 [Gandjariella thermophila]
MTTVIIAWARDTEPSVLRVRELTGGAADWGSISALVRSCSPATLRARFFLPQSPDPDDVLRRSRRYLLAGPPDGVALLASVGARPVGLLNLVAERDGLAEVAVLVADTWRHHGVGTYLADTVRALGRWQGWTVRASVQAANRSALALLRHHRAGATRFRGISLGEYEFATVIAPPADRADRRAG